MIIYDWGTLDHYLAFKLWPSAKIFKASPMEDVEHLTRWLEGELGPSETIVLHICLTELSNWHQNINRAIRFLKDAGHRVLNSELNSVSKRNIQQANLNLFLPNTIVRRQDAPELKVIIKTNRNYAGTAERKLSHEERQHLGVSFKDPRINRFDEYEITTLAEVSDRDWDDNEIVIEKFIENQANVIYRVYIVGTRSVVSQAINPKSIKKMSLGIKRTNYLFAYNSPLDRYPSEIVNVNKQVHEFAKHLSLDYGTVDVVTDSFGTAYIIDVNPTPGWGRESQSGMLQHLSMG